MIVAAGMDFIRKAAVDTAKSFFISLILLRLRLTVAAGYGFIGRVLSVSDWGSSQITSSSRRSMCGSQSACLNLHWFMNLTDPREMLGD